MGFTQLWRRIQRLCLYRRTAYRDFIRPDHRPGLPWTVGTWQVQNPPLHPPQKKTPYITFSCKRIEKERIVFPSSVYDERKKNFKERIELCCTMPKRLTSAVASPFATISAKKMHNPANNVTFARIRKSHPHADATDEQIIALILETLKDGQKHNLSEMTFPGISREKTAQLLHQMIEEETIRIQNGVLFLPRP